MTCRNRYQCYQESHINWPLMENGLARTKDTFRSLLRTFSDEKQPAKHTATNLICPRCLHRETGKFCVQILPAIFVWSHELHNWQLRHAIQNKTKKCIDILWYNFGMIGKGFQWIIVIGSRNGKFLLKNWSHKLHFQFLKAHSLINPEIVRHREKIPLSQVRSTFLRVFCFRKYNEAVFSARIISISLFAVLKHAIDWTDNWKYLGTNIVPKGTPHSLSNTTDISSAITASK